MGKQSLVFPIPISWRKEGRQLLLLLRELEQAGGQCTDMALVLADSGPKGRADPAFDARALPIGQWAQAIWHSWLPTSVLNRTIGRANVVVRLLQLDQVWRNGKGPATAMVAIAQRFGWQVCDARHLVADLGEGLGLQLDPPVIIEREVNEAMNRWRWQRISPKQAHLQHSPGTVQLEPVLTI